MAGAVGLLVVLLAAARAAAPPETIGLEEAMHRAEGVPAVQSASAGADAAAARVDQARGGRLPAVALQGDVAVWDSPLEISFTPSGSAPLDCSGVEPPLDVVCMAMSHPIPVRDQVTGDLSVRATQPLTGVLVTGAQVRAATAFSQAAEQRVAATTADARQRAAEAWLDARAIEAQGAIVEAQVRRLEAVVDTARKTYEAHAATQSDVLLAEVALGKAREAQVRVAAYRDLAWRRLGVATGSGGVPLRPAEGEAAPQGAPIPDEETLVALALAHRPEIVALHHRAEGAADAVHAATLSRVPQLSAVASYTHTEGEGFAVPTNAAFVGARLDWPLYVGGRRDAAVRGARAEQAGAEADLAQASDGVRLQVEAAIASLTAARAALEVSDSRVGQAEESLRAMEGRRKAGSATMTELLGAEADLVDARSSRVSAEIDARRAELALEHAVGTDPWDIPKEPR